MGETLLGHHWLKVEVQGVTVHQSVMEDRLHVKLKLLNGHVVQIAGQLLWVRGLWHAWAAVSVGVERAEATWHASPAEVAGEAIRHLHRTFDWRQTCSAPTVAQGHEQAAIHSRWRDRGLVHIVGVSVRETMWVTIPSSYQFCCMLAAAVWWKHATSAGLRHHSVHWRHELSVLVCICRQQLLQKSRSAVILAHRGPEAGLTLWQCLQWHGRQGVHSCLAIHTLVVLLLRLWDHAGGTVSLVPRAWLHHRRGGGLGGARGFCSPSNLRVVGWEQVQIVQKVLHDILRTVSQRARHLCETGQRGCHLGPRGSRVAHMHVCLPEIILGHERWEAAAQSAGIRAGPRPEAVPCIKVVVAVRVRAARPLGVGAWAVCTSVRATLQGQLRGYKKMLRETYNMFRAEIIGNNTQGWMVLKKKNPMQKYSCKTSHQLCDSILRIAIQRNYNFKKQ